MPNIYQRMSAITQEISTVAKNLNVGIGKNQYKAVGEADVLAAVKPIEAKHGVYSYPCKRTIVDSGELVSQSTYNGQTVDKRQLYMRVETVYRFVNMDEPTEYVDITTYGDGVDSQDKAPGKAMTYGDKYALLKAYKIQTGDDPDQNASEPLQKVNKGRKPAQRATQQTPAPEVEDRTGEAAYPDIKVMVDAIKAKAEKNATLNEWIRKALASAGARDLEEMAFMNENAIKAWYAKLCQKG